MQSSFGHMKFAPLQICRWSSVLYVTGDKASKQTSLMVPYLDIDEKFQNREKLKENINARKLDINIDKLFTQWQVLKGIRCEKETLENKRVEISDKLKECLKDSKTDEVEKYKVQGRLLKDELKTVMKALWALEESAILTALKLPNDLHPDTPLANPCVVFESGQKEEQTLGESHVEIGRKLQLLDFRTPFCYYLEGTAAEYELCSSQYISNFLKDKHFIEISCSDLVRSVILEGCGINYKDPNCAFILLNTEDRINQSRLHLTGGASLVSLCAYFSKHIVSKDKLPLKYVTLGRQYKPFAEPKYGGLFDACQASAVGVFVATSSDDDAIVEFKRILTYVTDAYKNLGYHFRIVYVPALELNMCESLCASIQMFSPYLKSYIEVGNLSFCGSYISKRLLMATKSPKVSDKFISIISGTVLSVPHLVGCAIENDCVSGNTLNIPEKIRTACWQ